MIFPRIAANFRIAFHPVRTARVEVSEIKNLVVFQESIIPQEWLISSLNHSEVTEVPGRCAPFKIIKFSTNFCGRTPHFRDRSPHFNDSSPHFNGSGCHGCRAMVH